jgi:hypothetical protein
MLNSKVNIILSNGSSVSLQKKFIKACEKPDKDFFNNTLLFSYSKNITGSNETFNNKRSQFKKALAKKR